MLNTLQIIGFKVGPEFFGADIGAVKEIIRVPDITAVPDTPEFVEGVVNLRGKIVPVIDMRRLIGLPATERGKGSRILVLDIDGRILGLIADSASEIMKVPENAIEPPPELISSIGAEYITGIGKLEDKLIIILDLEKLLSAEEIRKLEIKHNPYQTGEVSL